MVHGTSEVGSGIRFGYRSNEAGFGWTNAVFAVLLDGLSPGRKRDVLRRLERESEQEIALIAVGTQQGSDRIAKSFRPPTHVAKFGADPHST